jgi:hypothetical protein
VIIENTREFLDQKGYWGESSEKNQKEMRTMAKKVFNIPKERVVRLHGEEIEDVKKVVPPSRQEPYWILAKGKDDFIWATGEVSVTHTPQAKYLCPISPN